MQINDDKYGLLSWNLYEIYKNLYEILVTNLFIQVKISGVELNEDREGL